MMKTLLAAGLVILCASAQAASVGEIPGGTVMGRAAGQPKGPPVAVPFSDIFDKSLVDAPLDAYADDTSVVGVVNESRDNVHEKIALGSLVHNQASWFFTASTAPRVVSATHAGDTHRALSGGEVFFDIMNLPFHEDFVFSADATTLAYLDVGPLGVIADGVAGQLLQVGHEETVVIRRITNGIYLIVSSYQHDKPGYLKAKLPVSPYSGEMEFCTDCRKPGQGAGTGTGMPVFYNSATSAWFDTTGIAALN